MERSNSWISDLMKRVVSFDDLGGAEDEGEPSKVFKADGKSGSEEVERSPSKEEQREIEKNNILPEGVPLKREAAEISEHFVLQKQFILEGAEHSFYKRTFSKPTFCNFCTEFIWGLAEQGYSCEVCGYAVHTHCLKEQSADIPHTCRITNLDWVFWGKEAPPAQKELAARLLKTGDPFDQHHWVMGISAIAAKCRFCQKGLSSFSLDAHRCSRCKCTAHDKCILAAKGVQLCEPPQMFLLYHPKPRSPKVTPMVVFINCKSGGQQGEHLLRKFKRILGPNQAYNLLSAKPEERLALWKAVPNVRILACGGDGTVAWILQSLDRIDLHPPVGILPLGTGNDLSRTLGWGPGYEGEPIHDVLGKLVQARVVPLDRWEISLDLQDSAAAAEPHKKTHKKVMNNYFSVGVDAKIAHDFHTFREQKPELCASRIGNKLWYALNGVRAMLEPGTLPLPECIELEVDGQRLELPEELQGLIILNVLTYAGGADLWGVPGDEFSPPSINDGQLEIVGITGSFHMGTITAKLANALHIAQAHTVKITWTSDNTLPVQVDGEPWVQEPCTISVSRLNQAQMLCLGTPSAAPPPPSPVKTRPFAIENFFFDDDGEREEAPESSEEQERGDLDT